MTRRTLDQAVTYREVDAHFSHHPNTERIVRRNSTVKVYGPTGMVVYHNHPAQRVPNGTLGSICRMALMAGLAALLIAISPTSPKSCGDLPSAHRIPHRIGAASRTGWRSPASTPG